MFTKKNLIYFLIVLSLMLIAVNIIFEVTSKSEKKEILTISKNEIESKFASVLYDFGIKNSWIKKIHVKEKLSDSLDYILRISIPTDITIATIIKDVNNAFIYQPVEIETTEKKNYSNSTLQIYSNGILKLQASLNHTKEIMRDFAVYSFIVQTNFEDEEIPWNELEKIYFGFTYLITPSKIAKNRKEKLGGKYAILLNDKILETEYSLSEDYSKQKLVNNIHSIILDFGRDKLYLIDKTSQIYNSKIYNMLRDEFNKRGIKLMSVQNFPRLKGETKNQLISLFQFYATSLKGKEGKTFVVSLEDFLKLIPAIEKQIKKGDKVVGVKMK